jgi:hypothetical protein
MPRLLVVSTSLKEAMFDLGVVIVGMGYKDYMVDIALFGCSLEPLDMAAQTESMPFLNVVHVSNSLPIVDNHESVMAVINRLMEENEYQWVLTHAPTEHAAKRNESCLASMLHPFTERIVVFTPVLAGYCENPLLICMLPQEYFMLTSWLRKFYFDDLIEMVQLEGKLNASSVIALGQMGIIGSHIYTKFIQKKRTPFSGLSDLVQIRLNTSGHHQAPEDVYYPMFYQILPQGEVQKTANSVDRSCVVTNPSRTKH